MISFRNFALRRGERLLLSKVDIALHAGWRVGVVGRNGCGKTSLFAAILGEIEADSGDLEKSPKLRIASVAQETPSLPDAAIDFVVSGDTEVHAVLMAEEAAMAAEDWDAVAWPTSAWPRSMATTPPRAPASCCMAWASRADTHQRAVSAFSGGWRVRLNLARALMMPSDLLLLDEPTNHLDLDAVLWLEQWLLKYPGMLMMISHDREFLDGVGTHMLHLHEGKAKLYSRRLHQLRTPAFRAPAPAADRIREGTGRARPPAVLHRPLQGSASEGQAGAVAGQAPGQAGRHRSGARRARDAHRVCRSAQTAQLADRLNHVDAGYGDIK
jgi:ATP-binding cassette subfamily F protein 3